MAAVACCTLEGEYNRFGELALLDIDSGEVRLLDGHFTTSNQNKVHHTVSDIAFSRAGDRLFSSSYDKTIKVWSLPSGKLDCSFGECSRLLSPGGTDLRTCFSCCLSYAVHEDKVNRLAINPHNDQIIASCCNKGLLYIWNIDKDSKGLAIRDQKVGKFTADSIAFCGADEFVAARNCMTKGEKYKECEVFVCNMDKFECLFHFDEHNSYISSTTVFPHSRMCRISFLSAVFIRLQFFFSFLFIIIILVII